MRYKLTIEYDGTNFSGWQLQKNATTIQGTLIDAVTKVLEANGGTLTELQGSGRTDAGVHAYGQVAHLECEIKMPMAKLHAQINEGLPSSINVVKLEKSEARFHARHWAKTRQYVYRISKRRNVFEKKHVFWCKDELNVEAMRQCAETLLGMHDFSSFSTKPNKEKSPKVLLKSIEIIEEGDLILVRVRASHFLWNMVRILVGSLLEVGKGELDPEQMRAALETYTPDLATHRVPASGLFLENVEYKVPQPVN
jgi:tRNA pseudouridine38-40 synthase